MTCGCAPRSPDRCSLTGLRLLVEHGILRKEPYQHPGQRARHEYHPTDKGLALYPVVVAMAQWGDRYLADREGPPLQFEHRDCGAKVDVTLDCVNIRFTGVHRRCVPGPAV